MSACVFVAGGLLWMECKALYSSGPRVYLLDSYNYIDFIVLSMYLSSYALRFLVDRRIKLADLHYNGTTRARHALINHDFTQFHAVKDDIFADSRHPTYSYFMKACQSCGDFSTTTFQLPKGGRSPTVRRTPTARNKNEPHPQDRHEIVFVHSALVNKLPTKLLAQRLA